MTRELNTICPFCGTKHELVSGVARPGEARRTEPRPDDGDVTLCITCGQMCVFDRHCSGGLRRPNKQEKRTLATDALVSLMVDLRRKMQN